MTTRESLDEVEQSLVEFIRSRPAFPTLEEMCEHLGKNSTRSAGYRIEKLIRKGYVLQLARGKYALASDLLLPPLPKGRRAISSRAIVIPNRGKVSCGDGVENDEEEPNPPINLATLLARPDLAVFEAVGMSMIEAHIKPGDWLFVKENPDPPTGSTIVAMFDRDMICKKLALRQPDRVILKPANGESKAYDFNPARKYFRILGVLHSVLRQRV